MATTLFEFYKGQLPSIQERGKIFEQQGLGSAGSYTGAEQQNINLLGKLQTPTATPITTTPTAVDVTTLNKTTLPPLPTNTTDTTNYGAQTQATVAGALASVPLVTETKTTEVATPSYREQFNTLIEKVSGRPAAEAAALNTPELVAQRKAIQDYTNQLNAIAARSLAGQLTAEGRVAPMGAIVGEQATIQRQAKIESDIVSASLSASQGNYELAKNQAMAAVDTKFKPDEIKLANLEKWLQYVDKIPKTEAEQKAADALQAKKDALKEEIATKKGYTTQITTLLFDPEFQQNAPQPIKEQIKTILSKPGGATQEDMMTVAGLGAKYKVTPKTTDNLQFVSAKENQPGGYFNKTTGVFTPLGGGKERGVPTSYKSEIATTGREAVFSLLNIAEANPGIFGRTAAMRWIPNIIRSDAFRNYRAQLDYLKGNIIPAALTAMREASKTGGALGQVSDIEGAWLGSSLGALDMTQSPEQVVDQLKQIDKHLKIWQDAVNKYGKPSQGVTIIAPDGTEVEIIE